MKLGFLLATAAIPMLATIVPASAGVEFGEPDFPNYMSRIGLVTCDWQYPSYYRACPEPQTPPKPVEKAGNTAKNKSAGKAK